MDDYRLSNLHVDPIKITANLMIGPVQMNIVLVAQAVNTGQAHLPVELRVAIAAEARRMALAQIAETFAREDENDQQFLRTNRARSKNP